MGGKTLILKFDPTLVKPSISVVRYLLVVSSSWLVVYVGYPSLLRSSRLWIREKDIVE